MVFDTRSLSLYPEESGVYIMKDPAGKVLYIGKAIHLQRRVKQYFAATPDQREMIPFLIDQIETIETIVTLTEKDALILENNLIKRYHPKYNVLLKDDKTFISLIITQHRWPMLRLIRNKGKPKNCLAYFGPYTNALAARQTYDLIMKLFPLRQCSDVELASRKRPCLLYDIKRCLAPCAQKCSAEEYQSLVEATKRLLKGQDKELLKELKIEMQKAAQNLEFEKANEILHTIEQLEHVTSIQHVDNPFAKDCDVVGYHRDGSLLISLLQFREGKVIGSKHFSFHFLASSDEEAIESFLLQNYRLDFDHPPEIFLPLPLSRQSAIEEIISEASHQKIDLIFPRKGKKLDLIEMANLNAKAQFHREQDERSLREKMLLDLQETLHLTRYPRIIECFDTSNIAGTDPVASLASFVNGERDKSRTRLFRIKQSSRSEDYASMKEVIYRHFSKEKNKNDFCDLLIVDGGKGQLNIAAEVFQELGIASVDLIALAKENSRHDKGLSQEKIYVLHQKDPILIDPRSPMLFLLQRIRDEAHRIAIEFHRKKRSQRTFESELDAIEGIGPIKRRRILSYFGSVRALKAASLETLQKLEGFTRKDVERLWEFISNEPKD